MTEDGRGRKLGERKPTCQLQDNVTDFASTNQVLQKGKQFKKKEDFHKSLRGSLEFISTPRDAVDNS